MSVDIGPGDWVECINASPNSHGDAVPLTLGGIYRVAMVVETVGFKGECTGLGLVLHDVEFRFYPIASGAQVPEAFSVRRFRPIYRPKAEVINALLAPPARLLELT